MGLDYSINLGETGRCSIELAPLMELTDEVFG